MARHVGSFSALRHRNFRLYCTAQAVSNVGTWAQITVENWVVLQLSHSGLALGITNALQFGPSLLLGMYGGVIADRNDRRRLLMLTQTCLGLLALAIGMVAGLARLQVWMIWLAAGTLGLVKCFDLPALQGFVKDLVGPDDLANAIAWSNTISAMGRILGSVLGGVLLATTGTATGFLLNAASFALVVATLSRLRNDELAPRTRLPPMPGQIREALTYVRSQPALAATAIVMIVVFVCSYNFQVALALIASSIPGGGSQTYGALMSALGLGFAAGALLLARRASTGMPIILAWTCAIAVAQAILSCVSTTIPLLLATFAYGIGAGLFTVTVMSTLQLTAADEIRGRVMALYSICFLGGSLIGAPGFGWVASRIGVSATLRVAAGLCALAALIVGIVWHRRRWSTDVL